MSELSLSEHFLREAGAKHFVAMSYRATLPGQEKADPQYFFASCFIIATEGLWFLVTAGHVITKLQNDASKGVTISETRLQDKLAGNNFPFGVPFDFNLDGWAVLDKEDDGTDYAVAVIDELTARQLDTGGIKPIREIGWGERPFEQYPNWLMVGIPRESYVATAARHRLLLTLLPLVATEAPKYVLNDAKNAVFAKLLERPEQDKIGVNDIGGMSGGPVFGVKDAGDVSHYWVIGIQSFWYPDKRIVGFRPMFEFLQGCKKAIGIVKANFIAKGTAGA